MGRSLSASALRSDADHILLVSHGYEVIYERGFCNGVADAGVCFTLIGSDRTDVPELRPSVTVVNLRGSQRADRASWRKLVNLLRYHGRLAWRVASQRPVVQIGRAHV